MKVDISLNKETKTKLNILFIVIKHLEMNQISELNSPLGVDLPMQEINQIK